MGTDTRYGVNLAGVIGAQVPGLDVGVAVPVFGRHPLPVSSQAQTAQAATRGRFQLAVALGAPPVVEQAFGLAWERPVARLREFLTVLGPLVRGEPVEHEGELITARSTLPTRVAGARPPTPVLVAAMAPKALLAAGELADGLRRYADAGATEIVLTAYQGLDRATRSRTWRLAGALARAGREIGETGR
jgi:alkanesulfonate monooxygenase SsuD/methylene tetrahydromethanopterin reductase-like flavin-dependent oxidoreductase (luciferase family)